MIYFCCDEARRNAVKRHPTLNGIDFLDVLDNPADPFEKRQRTLHVHFLKDIMGAPPQLVLSTENIRIEGGERIRNISVTGVTIAPDGKNNVLAVEVSQPGDFSTYTLRLVSTENPEKPPEGVDLILAAVDFSFKVACESKFDCRHDEVCPPAELTVPEINYLAKDYASFRQLMLDRMSALMPEWTERNAADLGIALVELLAYVGDYLSYRQDAIATEAYLGTARRRTSVRRHARLVDYHMHDGSNARAWVHVRVSADVQKLPKGTQIFSRLVNQATLITPPALSPPFMPADYEEAINARPIIFETMHDAKLFAAHNEMNFYTWGDERCCLPKGATRASIINTGDKLKNVKAGDVLILIEARNPENGNAEEADPAHRHAVRLTKVTRTNDPLYLEQDGITRQRVLNIEWASEDALPFPLCLWNVSVDGDANNKQPASVAFGNIVLADHGETIIGETLGTVPRPIAALDKANAQSNSFCSEKIPEQTPPRFRPQLQQQPVTFAAAFDAKKPQPSATDVIRWPIEDFLPEVTLTSELDEVANDWKPQRDLLGSSSDKREFVVEVETDGVAAIRFGDDRFGSRPAAGTSFRATYRVGNGTQGN
ncbi:MAG: putative baseplate assembly protein, partial [Pyrinomonadaceae bacterium]|nr:putative baseplate assembly protein [Pyrinomonadaceae bacterium]